MAAVGEIRNAVIQAVRHIVAESQPGRGATLAEIAERSGVGQDALRNNLPKIKASGALQIVGYRRVGYRNRPVAEYAPAQPIESRAGHGWVDLGRCVSGWAR